MRGFGRAREAPGTALRDPSRTKLPPPRIRIAAYGHTDIGVAN